MAGRFAFVCVCVVDGGKEKRGRWEARGIYIYRGVDAHVKLGLGRKMNEKRR